MNAIKLLKTIVYISVVMIFLFLFFHLLVSSGYANEVESGSPILKVQHSSPWDLDYYEVMCQLVDGSGTEDFVTHWYPSRDRNSIGVRLNEIMTNMNSDGELVNQQYLLQTRVIYKNRMASKYSKRLLVNIVDGKIEITDDYTARLTFVFDAAGGGASLNGHYPQPPPVPLNAQRPETYVLTLVKPFSFILIFEDDLVK